MAKLFTFQRELQEFLQSQQLRLKPQVRLDDALTFSKIQQNALLSSSLDPSIPSRPMNPQSVNDSVAV